MGGASKRKKEEKMCKIITETELQPLSIEDLRSLFNQVSKELICSEPSTQARRSALASLENLQRAMAVRMAGPCIKPLR